MKKGNKKQNEEKKKEIVQDTPSTVKPISSKTEEVFTQGEISKKPIIRTLIF